MKIETFSIELTKEQTGSEHQGAPAFLTAYILNKNATNPDILRPAVIICPGGGYNQVSPRENECIATQFLSMGCHAMALEYSLPPNCFPYALLELAKSVAIVREHAEEWQVDPDKIIVCGFSAGGHLAGCLGVFWDKEFVWEALGLTAEDVKPNGMILCYPVITAGPAAHAGSFKSLLGPAAEDERIRNFVSLEKQVSSNTPKTFLWHNWTDQLVPVSNSLLFAGACDQAGVELEMHIYPVGAHASALANAESVGASLNGKVTPRCQGWILLAKTWLENL